MRVSPLSAMVAASLSMPALAHSQHLDFETMHEASLFGVSVEQRRIFDGSASELRRAIEAGHHIEDESERIAYVATVVESLELPDVRATRLSDTELRQRSADLAVDTAGRRLRADIIGGVTDAIGVTGEVVPGGGLYGGLLGAVGAGADIGASYVAAKNAKEERALILQNLQYSPEKSGLNLAQRGHLDPAAGVFDAASLYLAYQEVEPGPYKEVLAGAIEKVMGCNPDFPCDTASRHFADLQIDVDDIKAEIGRLGGDLGGLSQVVQREFDGINEQLVGIARSQATLIARLDELQPQLLSIDAKLSGVLTATAQNSALLRGITAHLAAEARAKEAAAIKGIAFEAVESGVLWASTLLRLNGLEEEARITQIVGSASISLAKAIDKLVANDFSALASAAFMGNVLQVGLSVAQAFGAFGPTPDEVMMEQLQQIQESIVKLAEAMIGRFDRIDAKLEDMRAELVDRLEELDMSVMNNESRLRSTQEALRDLRGVILRSEFDQRVLSLYDVRREYLELANVDVGPGLLSPEDFARALRRALLYADHDAFVAAGSADAETLDNRGAYRVLDFAQRADRTNGALQSLSDAPYQTATTLAWEHIVQLPTRGGFPALAATSTPNPPDFALAANVYAEILERAISAPLVLQYCESDADSWCKGILETVQTSGAADAEDALAQFRIDPGALDGLISTAENLEKAIHAISRRDVRNASGQTLGDWLVRNYQSEVLLLEHAILDHQFDHKTETGIDARRDLFDLSPPDWVGYEEWDKALRIHAEACKGSVWCLPNCRSSLPSLPFAPSGSRQRLQMISEAARVTADAANASNLGAFQGLDACFSVVEEVHSEDRRDTHLSDTAMTSLFTRNSTFHFEIRVKGLPLAADQRVDGLAPGSAVQLDTVPITVGPLTYDYAYSELIRLPVGDEDWMLVGGWTHAYPDDQFFTEYVDAAEDSSPSVPHLGDYQPENGIAREAAATRQRMIQAGWLHALEADLDGTGLHSLVERLESLEGARLMLASYVAQGWPLLLVEDDLVRALTVGERVPNIANVRALVGAVIADLYEAPERAALRAGLPDLLLGTHDIIDCPSGVPTISAGMLSCSEVSESCTAPGGQAGTLVLVDTGAGEEWQCIAARPLPLLCPSDFPLVYDAGVWGCLSEADTKTWKQCLGRQFAFRATPDSSSECRDEGEIPTCDAGMPTFASGSWSCDDKPIPQACDKSRVFDGRSVRCIELGSLPVCPDSKVLTRDETEFRCIEALPSQDPLTANLGSEQLSDSLDDLRDRLAGEGSCAVETGAGEDCVSSGADLWIAPLVDRLSELRKILEKCDAADGCWPRDDVDESQQVDRTPGDGGTPSDAGDGPDWTVLDAKPEPTSAGCGCHLTPETPPYDGRQPARLLWLLPGLLWFRRRRRPSKAASGVERRRSALPR